jgi:hypothetical protein
MRVAQKRFIPVIGASDSVFYEPRKDALDGAAFEFERVCEPGH